MDIYTGNILDPIHGLIKMSEIEKWIIFQKPFSRLKRIKQNTFLYYVFPSANHTRFEHSLGVMHIASEMYEYCKHNFANGQNKKEKYNLQDNDGFNFFSLENKLLEDEQLIYQELRLAALMHDIGHGPMSHKFDDFTLSSSELLYIIRSDLDLIKYENNFAEFLKINNDEVEHELISCLFIIKLINQLKNSLTTNPQRFNKITQDIIEKLNPERIVKLLEPKFPGFQDIIFQGYNITPFLSSIISNFPIDADRMDYLFRDSHFSGVKYGLYDISRLYMSMIPINIDNIIYLGIKESGIDSIIRFIQSRTHLYNQVYFHKTNRAANNMIDFACRKISKSESIIAANNYDDLENFFWKNSDELFIWNTLLGKIDTKPEKDVLDELLRRRLWKRVYQNKIIVLPNERIEKLRKINGIKDRINSKIETLEAKGIFISVDVFTNKVFKDSEKSQIKIAKKNEVGYEIKSDWKSFNKEISMLDMDIHMFRIYLRRDFGSSEEFLKLKNDILTEFGDIINDLNDVSE